MPLQMTMLPLAYRADIFADFRYVSANSVEANLIRGVLRRVFTAILGCDYRKNAAYESGGYQPREADPFHLFGRFFKRLCRRIIRPHNLRHTGEHRRQIPECLPVGSPFLSGVVT